ncbi:SprT family protein [Amphibacillus cookii]|uniref:SprT family protein n=1 Tax=Amphibacillus cookii TaxID=767787 RepID=UPI001959E313|nr:SprT family protein [Amphibacillus cookii]MBM7543270.1 SprT-like protein [Amphibacillus cookii]
MNDMNLQQLVERLSYDHFNKPFFDEAIFNSRLRTTGGRYLPSERRIEINPKYLVELGEKELIGIIKHELCHYHLHIEGKGYRHGDLEFKALLQQTGSPRHCQMLPSARKMFYLYKCLQCGQLYKRKKRINIERYRCSRCKGRIDFSNL